MTQTSAARLRLLAELERIVDALGLESSARSLILTLAASGDPGPQPASTGAIARRLRKAGLERVKLLGRRVCSDWSWHMLLELYASHEENRPVSVSALAAASGGPLSTALRQVEQLADLGFAVRRLDENDRRRNWVTPSEKGRAIMARLIAVHAVNAGATLNGSG